MIKRIKNKIVQFERKVEANQQLTEDHLALGQLLKMFDNGIFLPLTLWSVSPREVLHICNDIVINKRSNIIEFGSGFSTICIAQLLKLTGMKSEFISVEDNSEWADSLTAMLEKAGLQNYVRIIKAPIADLDPKFAYKDQTKWYDTNSITNEIGSILNFDLVIVDGPFGGTTPFARYAAISFLKDRLSGDLAVFLDDSTRDEEKEIGKEWARLLGGRIQKFKRYLCISTKPGFDIEPYTVKYNL